MTIRPYAEGDEPAVLRVWRECGLIVPLNDPVADIRRKLSVRREWFLVGEVEGGIVATCMAGYEGHRGWLNYLGVLPRFQRTGLAAAMVAHAEQMLRAAGCPKINLQVRTTNPSAIEFYRRIGYSIDEVTSMGRRFDPSPEPALALLVPRREPIRGDRICLVPYTSEHVEGIHAAALESVEDIKPWMGWCHPDYSLEEARLWTLAQPFVWTAGTAFEFVVTDATDGGVIGACGINQINPFAPFANLGYWIRTSRRGHGFAAEAVRLAAGFGFGELNLARIEIVVAVGNAASRRVAEKAGALNEGVLRSRLNVCGHRQDATMFSLVP